jgi:hypothetical protein
MIKGNSNIYIYPKFDSFLDIGIRIGGFGLANCLFVYSRAIILEKKYGYKLINPTWERMGIGQYLRKEKDKRNYFGLFKPDGVTGLKKYFLILFGKKIDLKKELKKKCIFPQLIVVEGLSDYFIPLLPYQEFLRNRILNIAKSKSAITKDNNYIGIHIRLGDYSQERRTSLDWYKKQILRIKKITQNKAKFLLFSDGSDIELQSILEIDGVKKCFAGNALADILTLSNCSFIIGSDSTFSGWAVFLGQKPAIFQKKHFGRILIEQDKEQIISDKDDLPTNMIKYLENIFNEQ